MADDLIKIDVTPDDHRDLRRMLEKIEAGSAGRLRYIGTDGRLYEVDVDAGRTYNFHVRRILANGTTASRLSGYLPSALFDRSRVPWSNLLQINLSILPPIAAKLVVDGNSTSALPVAPSASQVQSALEALPNVGSGNVTVAATAPSVFMLTFTQQVTVQVISGGQDVTLGLPAPSAPSSPSVGLTSGGGDNPGIVIDLNEVPDGTADVANADADV